MICFSVELLKYGYVIMLILWAGCFVALFSGIVRDFCFPQPEYIEQFDELVGSVPTTKFVSLDVAQLQQDLGCAPYSLQIDHDDTQLLLQM